jgi:hypothetical protein
MLIAIYAAAMASFDGESAIEAVRQCCQLQASAVKSCHAKYRWRLDTDRQQDMTIEFWMQGDKLRADVIGRLSINGKQEPKTTVGQNWPIGQYIHYQRSTFPFIVERTGAKFPVWNEVDMFTNIPSLLGLNLSTVSGLKSTDPSFLIVGRKELTAKQSPNRPELVILSGKSVASGAEWVTHHQTGFGHFPVYHYTTLQKGSNHYESSMTNILMADLDTKLVTIKNLDRWQKQNGVQTSRDRIDMLECRYNIEIDPKVFALADLNIPRGSRIQYDLSTDKKLRYWDGKRVVEQPLADIEKKEEEVSKKKADEKRSILRDAADEAPTSATRKGLGSYLMWAAFVFFLLAAAYFLRRMLTHRTSS